MHRYVMSNSRHKQKWPLKLKKRFNSELHNDDFVHDQYYNYRAVRK